MPETGYSKISELTTSFKSDQKIQEYISELYGKMLTEVKDISPEGDLLFRGQANECWKLAPSIVRQEKGYGTVDKSLLEEEKKFTKYVKELRGNHLSELDCIALLRHYGAPSSFIDFTRDFYMALYFSCQLAQEKNKEKEPDGKIFIIRATALHPDDTLSDRLASDPPFYFAPSAALDNRIYMQKGTLVYLSKKMQKEISIEVEYKRKIEILDYLDRYHGINERSVYPDIAGYAASLKDAYDETKRKNWNIQILLVQARRLIEKSDYTGAITCCNKAIELDPNNAAAYYNRGNANTDLERYEDAIKDYNKAIELDPKFAAAYYNRGNAYTDLERYEDAIQDYTEAIELDPKFAAAYYNRGLAYANLEHSEDAIKDWTKAIELDPKYAAAYYNRGLVYDEFKTLRRRHKRLHRSHQIRS